jgi:hypothetical protein
MLKNILKQGDKITFNRIWRPSKIKRNKIKNK